MDKTITTVNTTSVVRTCPFCNNSTKIQVHEKTFEAFYMYKHYGVGYIQDVPVPQFRNDHCKAIAREFLKSSYCLDCQQLLFGGDEKDYEEVRAYRG